MQLRNQALSKLWWGEQPLRKAFWLYFMLGHYGVFFLILLIYLPLFIAFGSLPPVLGLLGFVWLAYTFAALVGVWRSAARSEGSRAWALLAQGAVLLIVALYLVGAAARFELLMNMLVA